EPEASRVPKETAKPAKNPDGIYDLISFDGQKQYDVRDLLATVVDANSGDEYKADYGKTIVTAYAHIGGRPVGIVANQRLQVRTKKEGIQMGGVIYSDSADKAARFVMDCNQTSLPIIFFQDVTGFMVGRDAEESGIIRSGAKLVNAVSNSVVPKITVVVGGSFGAGNYAMCGKAYDPRFIIAWPTARYAVMGAAQASDAQSALPYRRRPSIDNLLRMPVVLIERQTPQITLVTLNRPERRNALTIELLTELVAAIKVASDEMHERILILRGAGAAFCT